MENIRVSGSIITKLHEEIIHDQLKKKKQKNLLITGLSWQRLWRTKSPIFTIITSSLSHISLQLQSFLTKVFLITV